MSDLDTESLEKVRDWAKRRLEGIAYRQQVQPASMAIIHQMQAFTRKAADELMAPARARSEESLAALEKSVGAFPEKVKLMEGTSELQLGKLRKRTEALERWLEKLS